MSNKEETFPRIMAEAKPVSPKTLSRLVLFREALIQPLKFPENIRIENVCYGQIIKLPTDEECSRFSDGEEWKKFLPSKNETGYNVGDKVLYNCNCKSIVVMDGVKLHLVSYFMGKIKDEKNK
jgi:hypothetical protein